ncbi:hypothetical protein FRC09_002010, partial [Ceratobasidium sp. 395]
MLTDGLIAELAELSLSRFELWLLSAHFISKPTLSKLTIGLGPSLSELAIPQTQISYEGLCIIAANLLNLRILELGSVYHWVERPQTGEHKHTTQPMHLKCKYWALDHATSTQVMMVARCLYKLWQYVECSGLDDKSDYHAIWGLNQGLLRLRQGDQHA